MEKLLYKMFESQKKSRISIITISIVTALLFQFSFEFDSVIPTFLILALWVYLIYYGYSKTASVNNEFVEEDTAIFKKIKTILLNLYCIKINDLKSVKIEKMIIGLIITSYFLFQIFTFLLDGSPALKLFIYLVVFSIIGFVYGAIREFFGFNTVTNVVKEKEDEDLCPSCGMAYPGWGNTYCDNCSKAAGKWGNTSNKKY